MHIPLFPFLHDPQFATNFFVLIIMSAFFYICCIYSSDIFMEANNMNPDLGPLATKEHKTDERSKQQSHNRRAKDKSNVMNWLC